MDDLRRLKTYRFTAEDATGRTWSFGRPGPGRPYAPHLKLLPGGALGGHQVEPEWSWRLDQGRIIFLHRAGYRSTVFTDAFVDVEGRYVLRGDMLLLPAGEAVHELREIAPKDVIHPGGLALDIVSRRPIGERRNLLVVRANEDSLHPQWPRDLDDADRTWDLCVSFYGAAETFGRDEIADHQILQNRDGKYRAIYKLFNDESPLWDYDYIGFADDDLMMSWRDVNRLFALCRRFQLQLAQPSLDLDSHVAHPITASDRRFILRYTSFVECMMPIFSNWALRACIPAYANVGLGFGLDNLWPKLIGEPINGIAIIDEVAVSHTRPLAADYVHWDALQEGSATQVRYEFGTKVVEYGGVYATPVPRQ